MSQFDSLQLTVRNGIRFAFNELFSYLAETVSLFIMAEVEAGKTVFGAIS